MYFCLAKIKPRLPSKNPFLIKYQFRKTNAGFKIIEAEILSASLYKFLALSKISEIFFTIFGSINFKMYAFFAFEFGLIL